MNPGNRERVKVLLDQAAPIPSAQRADFIRQAAGDDHAVAAEALDLLLTLDDSAFMSAPTAASPAATGGDASTMASGLLSEGPGTRIDRYKLLQKIGEGGFGTVFMAEQSEPVARRVALKIIKLGMDTRRVIARFEAERQALALMDHPNIARVLDSGATDTGRPYFVMDLVKGEPIAEYCDKNNLSIEGRLELFAHVCTAVQHAHTKGIIHRDIKPSNILVATLDGRPHAKVIDFGIAKATAGKLTEKTLFTEHKTLIGTPEYMSPEQAEGSLDIDTRTDVYSLGVLLYELLTGTTPFDAKRLRSAVYAEMQRIIREDEPPKPSTRLSENTDTLASIAAHRQTEPRRLGSRVRGELDWIVMKALEKDRQGRYETANGLAADIRRYLSGEAVLAAPPSTRYRLRKFLRRNRAAVSVGLVFVGALIVSLIGVGVGLVRAQQAQEAEAIQRKAAEDSAADAALKAARANRISDFLSSMLSSLYVSQSPGNEVKVRPIVDDASKRLDKGQLSDDPEIEADVRMQLGDTYRCTLKDEYSAEREYASAAATRERVLGPLHRQTLFAMHEVGTAIHKQERYAEAEKLSRLILERCSKAFGDEDPDTITAMHKLSWALAAMGRFDEAEPLRVRVLELRRKVQGEDHPATITAIEYLGNLYVEQGRLADAEVQYRDVLERTRRHYGPQSWQASHVMVDNVAFCLGLRGQIDGAVEMFEEALLIQRAYADRHRVARTLTKMGAACTKAKRFDEAERALTEALEILREVASGLDSEAWTLFDLGMLRATQNRLTEAEAFMREGLEIRRKIAAAQGKSASPWSLRTLASVLGAQGRQEEADELVREAIAIETNTEPVR